MSTWWGSSSIRGRSIRPHRTARADSNERVARLGGVFFRLRAAISEGLASTSPVAFLLADLLPAPQTPPYHLNRAQMADYERTPRVLVVEDDDAIAQVLQRSLRMEGYEVRIAGDGVVASTRRTPSSPTW